MKKKIFSIALVLCLLASLVCVPASADGEYDGEYNDGTLYYDIVNDEIIITDCAYDASGDLVIPDTISGYPVTGIGDAAFSDCKDILSVTIGSQIASIGDNAFLRCSKLSNISVDADNEYYSSQDSVLFNKDKTTLIQCSARKSGEYAIPNSVINIEGYAFFNCTKLTDITIGNNVTNIGAYAFFHCYSLADVTIGNGVVNIGGSAFSGCSSLTDVTIPNSVENIGSSAFSDCVGLRNIIIGNNVTSIGNRAFYNCSSLADIIIPNNVESIGNQSFSGCIILTNIIIGNNITSISDYAFSNCSALASVIIPNSVQSIGCGAFYKCGNLADVRIGNSVERIEEEAFSDCCGLKSITLSNSIKSIDGWAFYDCFGLTDVYYCGSEDDWKKISIDNQGNDDLISATIHYNTPPISYSDKTSVSIVDARCTEDSIKFVSYAEIKETDTVSAFGTILIPAWLFTSQDSSPVVIEYNAEEEPIENGNTYGATLTDIPDGYQDMLFIGKSYLKLSDGSYIWSKAKKVSIDNPVLRKVEE